MKVNNLLTLFIFSSYLLISCYSVKEINNNDKHLNNNSIIDKIDQQEIGSILKSETFNTQIRTVLCHKQEEELSIPIINLNSNEKLLVSFDDLDTDRKNYYYTIIHCNSDWTASDLMQGEYIDGFTNEPITDYDFSFNTIQKYTHYQFEFPSINIKPILSGNYIFNIYEENGNTIINKRFIVLETKLYIYANVRRATLAENRNTKHEIDFTIKHPNLKIADPFSDLKVHIKQNNREDNAIKDLIPQFVRNDELIYDYDDDNTFLANNEFRHFDFKSLRYLSDRINSIDLDSTYNHVYLFNDKKRSFDLYSITPDLNGKFLIKSQEGWKSSIEADYAFVYFSLPSEKIIYGDIYLLGAFSDWEIKKDFKLKYNVEQKRYYTNLYLKQGYYNYHYALKDTTKNYVDVSFIEGSHYQTRNDYYVYVYYRDLVDGYDRFVGFLKSSSKELF